MTLDGWLTTKKRGRDDAQIAADRQKALAARRKMTMANKKTKPTTAAVAKKAPVKKQKKKEDYSDDESDFVADDDDDSMNEFVVDDDEEDEDEDEELVLDDDEEEEEEESSSEEEELVIVDEPKSKKRTAVASKKMPPQVLEVDDSDDDDSSDEDGDGGTFFNQSYKARKSKPSQVFQRATDAAKNRRLVPLKATTTASTTLNKHPKKRTNTGGGTIIDMTKTTTTTIPAVKKQRRSATPKTVPNSSPSSSSSLDGYLTTPSPMKQSRTTTTTTTTTTSRFFEKKNTTQNATGTTTTLEGDDSEDGGDKEVVEVAPPKRASRELTKADDEDDDDDDSNDDDSPVFGKPKARRRRGSATGAAGGVGDSLGSLRRLSSSSTTATTKPALEKSLTTSAADDDDSDGGLLQDTPEPLLPKSKSRTASAAMKNNVFARFQHPSAATAGDGGGGGKDLMDSSDDDEEQDLSVMQMVLKKSAKEAKQQQQLLPKKQQNKKLRRRQQRDNDDDDSMDAQERKDLKKAMKVSKQLAKQQQKQQKSVLTVHNGSEEEEEPLADESLLNETSDEDDDNDNEDAGEEYSEEQKVASSVLSTAEQLSAQVLYSMMQWGKDNTRNEVGGKDTAPDATITTTAPQGMIVDGALSLGNLGGGSGSGGISNANGQWISQQVMKEACPGVTLSNYQLIGVNWLALLHGMKCRIEGKDTPVNGVLADEMGLGKTVQTIAFLAWLKYQRKKEGSEYQGPHIIVVPVSVLPNWMREFESFCPEMKVYKYHGSQAEREELQDELRQYLPGKRQQGSLDVILASVTYFQKEKSDDRAFLRKFKFDYLVVDEAHMLKNSQSTRYRNLDRVATKHRLLLTGTPVQNSPQELLNMLCFIMPLFSRGSNSSDAMDENDNVGDRMLQHFVDIEKEQDGDEQVAYAKLKQLFAPFVLRRKKQDVIAQLLPPKEQVVEYVDLDPQGREIYDSILKAHVGTNGTKITAAIGDHLFTNLRKAAHHPLLLRTRHNTPAEIEHLVNMFHQYKAFQGEGSTKVRVAEEIAKFNDFQIHLTALELIEENRHRRPDLERYILAEDALFSSAKFERLRSLLPGLIQDGHRLLIFSGWTSCLDLLGCLMDFLGLQYLRMDGSCPSDVRQGMIDEFNQKSSIQVFLLSTRACGLGINLTAADTCIMHDLDFNPFNDLQAEDRCHRIGQKKKVTIYKLVCKDTVDADIYEMQERKSKMNAAIMESSTESKKERKDMLQTAVNRFLSSPAADKKKKKAHPDDDNSGKEIDLV